MIGRTRRPYLPPLDSDFGTRVPAMEGPYNRFDSRFVRPLGRKELRGACLCDYDLPVGADLRQLPECLYSQAAVGFVGGVSWFSLSELPAAYPLLRQYPSLELDPTPRPLPELPSPYHCALFDR